MVFRFPIYDNFNEPLRDHDEQLGMVVISNPRLVLFRHRGYLSPRQMLMTTLGSYAGSPGPK